MALYTIGEVALLCDINPVTLRAWQRRYGLLKPQRTDGGHRLFNEHDIDRIQEIKRWIGTGVQVSKVKNLLSEGVSEHHGGWREHQETLLHFLHTGNLDRLRMWIKERSHDYPAQTLVPCLFNPLRLRLQGPQPTLQALLGILDGVLINAVSLHLAAARKRQGNDALVVGWNITDTTRLWLEGWIACEQGWRVDILAHPVSQLRPALFVDQTLLVWCGDAPAAGQKEQLQQWRDQGMKVWNLGN